MWKFFSGMMDHITCPPCGSYNFSWLGLSTQPVYPTNLPEPKPKTAQTDTSTVGGGSPPTKPNAFGSVGGFPLPKLEQPNSIINLETFGDIWRFFDENIQNPAIFEAIRWKFTWNPSDWTRFGEILSRSSPDPTRASKILSWSGQISTNLAKYWPYLDEFGQISTRSHWN